MLTRKHKSHYCILRTDLIKLFHYESRFKNQLPGAFCCGMVPAPYSDKMESLESCFFADSSDFVCSMNRSRSPDAADKAAAAGLVEALWEIKVKCDY